MKVRRQNNRILVQVIKLRVFIMLTLMITVLLASYVTFIGLSVKNVVIRKEAETRTAMIRAEISQMENEYITRVSGITMARASGAGLGPVASKGFTERRVLVGQAN